MLGAALSPITAGDSDAGIQLTAPLEIYCSRGTQACVRTYVCLFHYFVLGIFKELSDSQNTCPCLRNSLSKAPDTMGTLLG